jgi:hypothetical protein
MGLGDTVFGQMDVDYSIGRQQARQQDQQEFVRSKEVAERLLRELY